MRIWPRIWLGALGLVLLLHVVFEGAHWQMAPAYLAIPISALLCLRVSSVWRISGVIVALAVITCGLSYVLPMFSLPQPTGRYEIGTRIVAMVDTTRVEDAEPNHNQPRNLVTQFWYPALASHNPRAPYRRPSETRLASSYQSVNRTHARYDAPLAQAEGGFPLLIYNPGWNGRRTQNTVLMEELASHGYVVAAIDHPYNSGPVEIADGRVIRPIPAPQLFDDATPETAIYALIETELEKETDDALFVLQRAEQMNADPQSPLYHALNLSQVGALGYSLGAAVGAEMAMRDGSIRAVLDLDSPLYGEAAKNGIAAPFLLLCGEIRHFTQAEIAQMPFGQRRNVLMTMHDYAHQLPLLSRPGDYQIEIRGTIHTSFQDNILTSPLQSISQHGAIPPEHLIAIVRQYSVAFFDQSLRGIPSPLLAAKASPFADAIVLFSSQPSLPAGTPPAAPRP